MVLLFSVSLDTSVWFHFPLTPWSQAAVHSSIVVTLTSGWANTKMASVILASCSDALCHPLPSNGTGF